MKGHGIPAGGSLCRFWITIFVALGSAAVFAWITFNAAVGTALQTWDSRVTDAVIALRTPAWEHVFWGSTLLGNGPLMATLIVGFVALSVAWGRWRTGLLVTLGAGIGQAISSGTKDLLGRARPPVSVALIEQPASHSLPSGHAMMSLLFLGLLLIVFLDDTGRYRRAGGTWGRGVVSRTVVVFVAAVLALLIGVSRVFLGVHWASDVVAGWALAALWLTVIAVAMMPIEKRVESVVQRKAGGTSRLGLGRRWRMVLLVVFAAVTVVVAVLTAMADPLL